MVCRECEVVAKHEGILFNTDIIEQTLEVAERTSDNTSSMLQDILKDKKTEVNEIHGSLISIAYKHGLRAPLNEFIMCIIKAMENVRHLGWPDDHLLLSRRGP